MIRTHIMIHHSLTADGQEVSWGAIERYHRETDGWRDIGYHAGVEETGSLEKLGDYRYQGLVGRPIDEQASACPQGEMNRVALHVCCVGNYDLIVPPQAMIRVLIKRFLLPWMRQFSIPPDRIVGHRDFNPAKSCPGKLFDLDMVRRLVQ